MHALYIDCRMGAAGDMLAASLLELQPDRAAAIAKLNALGVEGVAVVAYIVCLHHLQVRDFGRMCYNITGNGGR